MNFNITKVIKIGPLLASVGGGIRYWAETTAFSPGGVGFRLQITFLPKAQSEDKSLGKGESWTRSWTEMTTR